jgi:tRNA(Ile)-lysidine synthase TilS/MesJ
MQKKDFLKNISLNYSQKYQKINNRLNYTLITKYIIFIKVNTKIASVKSAGGTQNQCIFWMYWILNEVAHLENLFIAPNKQIY